MSGGLKYHITNMILYETKSKELVIILLYLSLFCICVSHCTQHFPLEFASYLISRPQLPQVNTHIFFEHCRSRIFKLPK